MNILTETTTTQITDTTGDHLLILNGQQRKEFFPDITSTYKPHSLLKRALTKAFKKLSK